MNVDILTNARINVNAALELLGDMETYNETLEDFLSEIDQKVSDLEAYRSEGDMANYAILVHSLKSDSKYLGFMNLADLAYNHEVASKENNVQYVNSNYDFLIQELNRVLEVVREYMKGNEKPEESVVANPFSTKKILLVDDSNIIRNFVQKLYPDEYAIIAVDDGEKAIEIVKQEKDTIKGVILDLNMPKVDGFAVLDFFKNNNVFEDIPVTVITGDDSKNTIMKAFEYPIVDVLNKPFSETTIRNVVSKMVNYKK